MPNFLSFTNVYLYLLCFYVIRDDIKCTALQLFQNIEHTVLTRFLAALNWQRALESKPHEIVLKINVSRL